jgi:hypothetical protein
MLFMLNGISGTITHSPPFLGQGALGSWSLLAVTVLCLPRAGTGKTMVVTASQTGCGPTRSGLDPNLEVISPSIHHCPGQSRPHEAQLRLGQGPGQPPRAH